MNAAERLLIERVAKLGGLTGDDLVAEVKLLSEEATSMCTKPKTTIFERLDDLSTEVKQVKDAIGATQEKIDHS